jgi:polysaccharide chain length determinant protein (PEP-CTERM system associated)
VLPGKKYTPDEVLRIVLKYKWLILAPFVVATIASILVARQIPEKYQSETLIMVVPQRIPESYVKSTDATRIEERLPSISEQIQSRSRLERIITEFDLYKKERAEGVMEDVVQRMRDNIDVKLEGKAQQSFRIKYVSSDPRTAQKVTERLASWYVEENLRDRENLATNTGEFLNAALEDAKRRLVEQEKKVQEYRQRYSGQLPTQLDGNLQAIQNAQLQLQVINESINRARERRLLIERQLADVQASLDPGSSALAAAPGGRENAPELTTAQQLENAEALLQRYKLRFTPDHPDVRTMERTVRELRARVQAEPAPGPQSPTKTLSTAEGTRQKRIRDLQSDIAAIDRQIVASEGERGLVNGRVADYQSKVDSAPARESDMIELTRDYETLQRTYASLLTKREDSKLAANLERRQIGEQFKVLDPPSLPQRPVKPMLRLAVSAGGSAAGLLVGLLLAGVLEFRDSTFRTEKDVTSVLGLPVLALVPTMEAGSGLIAHNHRERPGARLRP